MKGLRQSDIFKCNFHQHTKAFWAKIKFAKINLLLLPWFYLQSYVYQKITDISPIYGLYSFLFRFILVSPFLKFGPLPSKNLRCALVLSIKDWKKFALICVIQQTSFGGARNSVDEDEFFEIDFKKERIDSLYIPEV